jgi:hypothetical protein
MRKGQMIEDKHAQSWGQVSWVLGWRHTSFLLLFFYFSLFFKAFLLFYSLKSQSLDLHCPIFPLISNITPKVSVLRLTDTATLLKQPTPQPANQLHPPSVSLLYTVANKEVEPQFSSRGVTL